MVGLFLLLPPSGHTEPELRTALDPPRHLQEGRTCQFMIRLRWRSLEANYLFSQPRFELDNLTVEEIGESNETFQEKGEIWRKKTFLYKLRALRSGKGRIHPFRVSYTDPHKGETDHFEVGGLEIQISRDRRLLFQAFLIALGFIGITVGGFLIRRNFRKNKQIPVPEASLEERYLQNLTHVSSQISAFGKLFRSYLAEKYLLPEGGGTTPQVLGQLEKKLRPDEWKTLKKIFDKLDEYRFGNLSRPEAEQEELYRDILRFVEGKKVI